MTTSNIDVTKAYPDTLHALCPYFAMFPPSFAHDAINKFSEPGDLIIDPFSGRGTTLLEARLMGRRAIGNDINPVAFYITKAKSHKIILDTCLLKVIALRKKYDVSDKKLLLKEAHQLPTFFQHAYASSTLVQILWLRNALKNVLSPELIFIKTLCLSYLHGEVGKTKQVYFSNNLPHTYCPKPDYSVKFWNQRNMIAPEVDVFDILLDRTIFRLQNSKQLEATYEGECILGDVRNFHKNIKRITDKKAKLVVTSPPYIKITSYEADQWLRLWFLGHQPYPATGMITKDDMIASQEKYINFLAESWRSVGKIMKRSSILVCRIGQSSQDKYPLEYFMKESLSRSGHKFKIINTEFSPFKRIRQAQMFGNTINKNSGEFDFTVKIN